MSVDRGLRWARQIKQVRTKWDRLPGVLGRAGRILGSESLLLPCSCVVPATATVLPDDVWREFC